MKVIIGTEVRKLETLVEFDAWAGGLDTLNSAKEAGLEDELQELFEQNFDLDEPINEDDLNNWLWFDDEVNALVYGE